MMRLARRLTPKDKHFLWHAFRRAALWPLAGVLLACVGWALVYGHLEEERQKIESTALSNAQVHARAYAYNLFRALEAVDQLTLFVQHGWQASNGEFALETIGQNGLIPSESGFFVSIIDEWGNLVSTTVPNADRPNVAEEPYFTVHQQDPHAGFHIGVARVGNFSGAPVVPFSRRLSAPDGTFRGILLVSVVPDYFTSSYDEVALRGSGFLAILSADRSVRLARIGRQIYLPNDDVRVLKGVPELNAESGSTVLDGGWFTDGRLRYVGWEETAAYGMTTLVGLDGETVLAPYWSYRQGLIESALLATLAFLVLKVIAVALYLRLAWRKYQFETMQTTYRVATESGSEGFFIAHPIHDKTGAVIDFEVTDCNDRGAGFLGLRRDELVGRTARSLCQRRVAQRVIRVLREAMAAGSYEGEADWRGISQGGPRWVHVRISRPAADLAVTVRDISEEKAHVAELERRGNEDALTGLPNRHWLNHYLPQAVERAAAEKSIMALLFIDLDGFKVVNDTLGHEAGDEVLRHVGRRLREAVRPHDRLVRLGGDEFLVVVDHIGQARDAGHVAERILEAFQSPIRTSRGTNLIGTSIGISLFPTDGHDANTLLNNADIAMYSVKSSGKRNFRYFDQRFYDQVRARHRQESELREALEKHQFVMYYQPRVDVSTGVTCSMEALVRWMHPTRGVIEPNEFIPLAEATGLIVPLGEQVIDMVCAQLARWAEKGEQLVPVSINVSPRQFDESRIDKLLAACIARHHVDPAWMEIELTESTMSANSEEVAKVLHAIQKMGIKLLVDDFGVGYSSLSQLQRLDFDVLKVDRSFTADLQRSKGGVVFFTAIITMAHALGMRVVAEGVENLEQLRALKALDCDEIQGYFISVPLLPTDMQPILPRFFLPAIAGQD